MPAAPFAPTATPTPEALLERFGLSTFRPGQREAVAAALAGRDSLVVMPTGGGKSLCYQLPALAGEGLVVVVSPLIALMTDQLRRLREAAVPAAMLASGMAEGHNAQALREIAGGQTRLVLVAPERFASVAFREALARRRVSLFVVDEAHCVAEWGHDFRPDYLRLRGAIDSLAGGGDIRSADTRADSGAGDTWVDGRSPRDRPPVMAATATATPRVAEEIAARLGLREWLSVRAGFDRPNLAFDVVSLEGTGAVARKRAALLHVLAKPAARPAIVYCGTRRDTEAVAELIGEAGIATVAYHAGFSPEQRRRSQEAFMEGAAEVVVATNAFGMGVDKADVRTVAHWALPTSLEAYYQEAGRGGRDGRPARALLLAARMDLGRLIRFNRQRETTVADVRAYVGTLRRRADPADGVARIGHDELGERERMLLSIAERAGAVELRPGGAEGLLARPTGQGSPRKAWAAIKAAKDRGWESYRSIERYMSGCSTCRRRQILTHFGDSSPGAPMGRCCDVCDPDPALAEALLARPSALPKRQRAPARVRERRSSPAAGGGGVIRAHSRTAAENAPRGSTGTGPGGDPEGALPVVAANEFERLRQWRYVRAEGKPAYTVAANAALENILRVRPRDLDELRAVHGIGPTFCERHGESLLGELTELEGRPRGVAPTGDGAPRENAAPLASVSTPT